MATSFRRVRRAGSSARLLSRAGRISTRSEGIDIDAIRLRIPDGEVRAAQPQLDRVAHRRAPDEGDGGAGHETQLHEAAEQLRRARDLAHDRAGAGLKLGQGHSHAASPSVAEPGIVWA